MGAFQEAQRTLADLSAVDQCELEQSLTWREVGLHTCNERRRRCEAEKERDGAALK